MPPYGSWWQLWYDRSVRVAGGRSGLEERTSSFIAFRFLRFAIFWSHVFLFFFDTALLFIADDLVVCFFFQKRPLVGIPRRPLSLSVVGSAQSFAQHGDRGQVTGVEQRCPRLCPPRYV